MKAVPAEDDVLHFTVLHEPLASEIERSIPAGDERGQAAKFREALLAQWAKAHCPIQHEDQEQLPKRVESKDGCCHLFARCMCGVRGKQSLQLERCFRRKLATLFRDYALLKESAAEADLVLCLSVADGDYLDTYWLHVSSVSFGVLPRVTCWQLNVQRQQLERVTLVPRRSQKGAPTLLTLSDICHHILGQSLLQSLRVRMSCYHLVNTHWPVCSAQPQELEVQSYEDSELRDLQVWPPYAMQTLFTGAQYLGVREDAMGLEEPSFIPDNGDDVELSMMATHGHVDEDSEDEAAEALLAVDFGGAQDSRQGGVATTVVSKD